MCRVPMNPFGHIVSEISSRGRLMTWLGLPGNEEDEAKDDIELLLYELVRVQARTKITTTLLYVRERQWTDGGRRIKGMVVGSG